MNVSLISSFALAATVGLASAEWTVTLVQKQLATGNTFQSSVSSEGRQISLAPIPEEGSEFFLWAIEQVDGQADTETLIDTEVVGAYQPEGSLTITTPDPYAGAIPRTRIDQGFTLNYSVGGLVTDNSEAPAAAQQVIFNHDVANYQDGYQHGGVEANPTLGLVGSAVQILQDLLLPEVQFDQRTISENGSHQIVYPAANISGTDVYNDAGLETFKLYALADDVVAETKIAEAQVQVWPLSKAEFIGIESGGTYGDIPEVTVDLTGLYPSSKTWVQVYSGAPKIGTEGTKLNQSTIEVDDDVPRATSLVFRDLNSVLDSDGQWTLEVLTETPFGTERLSYTTLNVGRELQLRGRFNTLDD